MFQKKIFAVVAVALILTLLVVAGPSLASMDRQQAPPPPTRLTYQGHLLDDTGDVVDDGTYTMTFSLWDALSDGTQLWGPETHQVETSGGFFAVTLGSDAPIDQSVLAAETHLEIGVDGETLSPRQALESVAFALSATEAQHAGDADRLDGQPASYYRDWHHITAMPGGFADGVDDDTIYTDTHALEAVRAAGYLTETGMIEVISDTDTITVSYALSSTYAVQAGEVTWSNVTNVPADLADGDDVDDTVDWSEISGLVGTGSSQVAAGDHGHPWGDLSDVPPGLDDGDDDTIYTDTDAVNAVEAAGNLDITVTRAMTSTYVTTQVISATHADDADQLDGHDGSYYATATHGHPWGDLTGVPSGLDDGDDDTTYLAGNQLSLSSGIFSVIDGAGSGLDADTLDGQDGSSYAPTYHGHHWSDLNGVPAGLDDGDDVDDIVDWSEISGLVGTGSNQVAAGDHGHPWSDLSGVPAGLDDGDDNTQLSESEVVAFADGDFLPMDGEAYVIVDVTDDPATNGDRLMAAYATAKALTPHGQPLAADNRAVVFLPPGQYSLDSSPWQLELDTDYVDIIGLSSNRNDQFIYGLGQGVIVQTANNVHIANLKVEHTLEGWVKSYDSSDPAAYFPEGDETETVIRNCSFDVRDYGSAWVTRYATEYPGTYINVHSEGSLFGGTGSTASGTFEDCTGGAEAFGGGTEGVSISGGIASGTFKNCTGGQYAFGGGDGATASGTFINCTGDDYSFGSDAGGIQGDASGGVFRYCTGEHGSFTMTGSPSPTHLYCIQDGAPY